MSQKLVNEQQPFGKRFDTPMHQSTLPNAAPTRNVPHGTTAVGNNGRTVVESFADKNPNAYKQACAGRDNPFGPVGKNFGTGKTNLTDGYSNAN